MRQQKTLKMDKATRLQDGWPCLNSGPQRLGAGIPEFPGESLSYGNLFLNRVEGSLWDDVLRDQLSFQPIGPIDDDSFRHVLA